MLTVLGPVGVGEATVVVVLAAALPEAMATVAPGAARRLATATGAVTVAEGVRSRSVVGVVVEPG